MKCSDRGIPIFNLSEKIGALRYCLTRLDPPQEDAMAHLFDLIHHIAPGYRFCGLDGIQAICGHYGDHPTPIDLTPETIP